MKRPEASAALLCILLSFLSVSVVSAADRSRDYYVEFHLGQSLNGEDSLQAMAGDLPAGTAEVDYETGFHSGFAVGKRFGERWRLEGEYLYRTDELGFAEFSDGTLFEEGDYSSVVVSANAYYDFPDLLKESPRDLYFYLGAGLGWVQEVDIDFESGEEISFESDDFGYQLIGGLRWEITPRWSLDFEYRTFTASDVRMTNESGSVTSDYQPVSLGFAVGYSF